MTFCCRYIFVVISGAKVRKKVKGRTTGITPSGTKIYFYPISGAFSTRNARRSGCRIITNDVAMGVLPVCRDDVPHRLRNNITLHFFLRRGNTSSLQSGDELTICREKGSRLHCKYHPFPTTMITKRDVGTHLGASANTLNTQQSGRTKVRPYKTLSFNALQRTLQKGADYPVNRC